MLLISRDSEHLQLGKHDESNSAVDVVHFALIRAVKSTDAGAFLTAHSSRACLQLSRMIAEAS